MEEIEKTILNGLSLCFGFITISDKKLLLDGFEKLSTSTKRFRFHQPKTTLTEKEANYFLDIDNYNHLAIGAVIEIENKEYGVGLIRYIREKNNSECAEVGLTVIDSFQHYGIGTELYTRLLNQAKKNNIKSLVNHVLKNNKHMIDLLNKFDGLSSKQCDGTTIITVKI